MPPKSQHHKQRANNDSRLESQQGKGQSLAKLLLEGLAITGLLIIGYMFALSPSHRVFAVWVFFAAWVGVGLAVAIPLAREFSRPLEAIKQGRPYLWVKAIDSYLDKPSLKENGVVVEYIIENASDSPAFNVICDGHLTVISELLSDVPSVPPSVFPSKNPSLFLPAKGVQHQILPDPNSFPFDETLIPLIDKSEQFLYVHGAIHYDDSNNRDKKSYTCNFCFLYEPKLKNFSITKFGNECP